MPRKASQTLTDAELRIMDVVWDLGEATVADVVSALERRHRLAYSSVLTTMRILEQKGYLVHRQEGRAFVYRPKVDRQTVRRKAVRSLIGRLFENSPELLLLNVIKDEKLGPEDLERLRQLVDESERGER